MALMHGKQANIYWDSQGTDTELQHGQNWSIDVTHDTAEITCMQDTNFWKTYLTGHQDWTATVECLLDTAGSDITPDSANDPDGLADAGARLELYLVYDTGTPAYRDVYGEAVCTGISYSATADGVPTVTYTFTSNGQMQWHSSGAARP